MAHPSVNDMMRLYGLQEGRGLDDGLLYYKSSYRRQRGSGLGSIFGSIARKLIPFATKYLLPAAKKYVVPHAVEAAKNITDDIIAGKNVKETLKQHGSTAIKGIGSQILGQSGSGRRRKRKLTKSPSKKKVKKSKKPLPTKLF